MNDSFIVFVYKCILSLLKYYESSHCKNPEELKSLYGISSLCVCVPLVVSSVVLGILCKNDKIKFIYALLISIAAFILLSLMLFFIVFLVKHR